MRARVQASKIWATKETSRHSPLSQSLKLFTGNREREFFKYQDGELVEYELTRCNGKNVLLSEAELQGMEEFLQAQDHATH